MSTVVDYMVTGLLFFCIYLYFASGLAGLNRAIDEFCEILKELRARRMRRLKRKLEAELVYLDGIMVRIRRIENVPTNNPQRKRTN